MIGYVLGLLERVGLILVDMALLGAIFGVFSLALSRIGATTRTNFVVQHPVFGGEQLRELIWPILNRLMLGPVLTAVTLWMVGGALAEVLPHQVFAAGIARLPFGVQVLVGTMIVDFVTYWRHRFVHHFAWPYHAIHHAAREIRWTTTNRLHPGDVLVMSLIRIPLMYVLGFEGRAMVVTELVYTLMNLANHLNLSLDWPAPLRYLLVSPNMHRWHHAADDPAAINKNYSVVWAFWDVLFGTFYVPKDRLPDAYGVQDEQGGDVIAPGVLAQLVHPFRQHYLWLRDRLGRPE